MKEAFSLSFSPRFRIWLKSVTLSYFSVALGPITSFQLLEIVLFELILTRMYVWGRFSKISRNDSIFIGSALSKGTLLGMLFRI